MIKRILLVNDDGFDAKGLQVAERIAHLLCDDVWVFAPNKEYSGTSSALSFNHPVRLEKKAPQKFSVEGTPVDCVMIAVHHLVETGLPDLILSGVNRGQNVAEDVIYSGTLAAARHGLMLSIPSIALSQSLGMSGAGRIYWETAEHYAPRLIERLVQQAGLKDVALNINFPDHPPEEVVGVAITKQGKRDHPLMKMVERKDPKGRSYYWIGFNRHLFVPEAGTDIHAIYSGHISITPIGLDLTDHQAYQELCKQAFLESDFDSLVERDIVLR